MNEGKLRDQVDRAARAETLLREPMITEAFETLEKEFVSAWKESGIADQQSREHIYQLLQALEAFKGHFVKVLEDGKLAKDRLKI
tara:strand:- start:1100 stop:1354 length:255 start_codon:yes stop_codon:yes gene_type:complete